MGLEEIAARDAQGLLNAFGERVTYTPVDGIAVELDALVNRDEKIGSMNAVTWTVEILKTAISAPESGDTITIGSQQFDVHNGGDTRINHDGVWWKIPIVYDERSRYRGNR